MSIENLVKKATDSLLLDLDWSITLEICDRISSDPSKMEELVKAIKNRLKPNGEKDEQIRTIQLLEATIKNSGYKMLTVYSQAPFINHLRAYLLDKKLHPSVQLRGLQLVQNLGLGLRNDKDLHYSSLYTGMKVEAYFPPPNPDDVQQFTAIGRTKPSKVNYREHPAYPKKQQQTRKLGTQLSVSQNNTEILESMLIAIVTGGSTPEKWASQISQDTLFKDLIGVAKDFQEEFQAKIQSGLSDETLLDQILTENEKIYEVLKNLDGMKRGIHPTFSVKSNPAPSPAPLVAVEPVQNQPKNNPKKKSETGSGSISLSIPGLKPPKPATYVAKRRGKVSVGNTSNNSFSAPSSSSVVEQKKKVEDEDDEFSLLARRNTTGSNSTSKTTNNNTSNTTNDLLSFLGGVSSNTPQQPAPAMNVGTPIPLNNTHGAPPPVGYAPGPSNPFLTPSVPVPVPVQYNPMAGGQFGSPVLVQPQLNPYFTGGGQFGSPVLVQPQHVAGSPVGAPGLVPYYGYPSGNWNGAMLPPGAQIQGAGQVPPPQGSGGAAPPQPSAQVNTQGQGIKNDPFADMAALLKGTGLPGNPQTTTNNNNNSLL